MFGGLEVDCTLHLDNFGVLNKVKLQRIKIMQMILGWKKFRRLNVEDKSNVPLPRHWFT